MSCLLNLVAIRAMIETANPQEDFDATLSRMVDLDGTGSLLWSFLLLECVGLRR